MKNSHLGMIPPVKAPENKTQKQQNPGKNTWMKHIILKHEKYNSILILDGK